MKASAKKAALREILITSDISLKNELAIPTAKIAFAMSATNLAANSRMELGRVS